MLETYEIDDPGEMRLGDIFGGSHPFGSLPLGELNPVHKHSTFAAGEQNFTFEKVQSRTQIAIMRGASGDDLVALRMWADGLADGGQKFHRMAFIPYLPGARSDRYEPSVFQAMGAKTYARMINECHLDRVLTIDPHSDVMPALIDNVAYVGASNLVQHIRDHDPENFPSNVTAVMAPDAGARKRAESVAEALGVPCFYASKHRDFATKELSDFQVPLGLPITGTILVVDDICDGGRTLVGLANALHEQMGVERSQLALWVTHGIFTYDAPGNLDQWYSWIGTTDSHPGSAQVKAFTSGYVLDLQQWLTTNKHVKPYLRFS